MMKTLQFRRMLALALTGVLLSATGCAPQAGSPVHETTVTPATTAVPETTAAPVTTATPETDPASVKPTPPKSLKVLAIGNSFSTDAMQYLAQIALNLGVEEVVLGNLYIGGCSLDTHYGHAKLGDGAYTYYKTTTGSWSKTEKAALLDGLKDEAWDVITLQQTSKTSGLPDSYRNLSALIGIVEENKPESARLVWHMTWAYQQDSTHSSFPNYQNDQMTMYRMILSATAEAVDPLTSLTGVIPTGTAIQNARTGFIGDTLTRDGYHLSYNVGRMLAGMTWYAALTGCPVEELSFNPAPTEITDDVMALLKESAAAAIASPREVTESTRKTGEIGHIGVTPNDVVLEPEDCYEADLGLAAANNVDLSQYTLYPWEYLENTYWYSTKHANTVTPSASAGTYHQNVCSDKMFSREELPVGTVIICDGGWQYRPERWPESKAPVSSRPGMADGFVCIDEAWWGDNAWCAFNLSSSPKTDISANYAAAAAHLRIYVPRV